jgi:hypothetical protein
MPSHSSAPARTPARACISILARHGALLPMAVLVLTLGSCHSHGEAARDTPPSDTASAATPTASSTTSSAPLNAEISGEIAELAGGKNPDDEVGESKHDAAVSALTARGSAVELSMVDALHANADWNVRLGCIEVLQSVGTKACVAHLIFALRDSEPLVALRANYTLEALTKHNEIPAADAHTGANGLPPIPARPSSQLGMDVELKIWTTWYHEHGQALHDAWDAWWRGNSARISID